MDGQRLSDAVRAHDNIPNFKRNFLKNGVLDKVYGAKVSRLIRRKYTLDEELALSRQRDTKPEEWEAYNAYCEECKAEAKAEVYG